jgi:hypothetical protein
MPSNAPITQEMTIPEIVEQYPQTQAVFKQYGLNVQGYKALEHENLFATSRVHQIDLQKILQDLNRAVQA